MKNTPPACRLVKCAASKASATRRSLWREEICDARTLKALKVLEDENRKLKKLMAESMLDASTLEEMLVKDF